MMENHVGWISDVPTSFDWTTLAAEVSAVLSAEEYQGLSVSILVTDDPRIQTLNSRWRGIDAPTDVLSFPQTEPKDIQPGVLLGDIVISLDTAKRQAAERGHPLLDEMRILVIHGLAHLLGHDHKKIDDAKEMAELENRLLCVMTGSDELPTPGLVQMAMDEPNV